MIRKGSVMKLYPGIAEEYEKRHIAQSKAKKAPENITFSGALIIFLISL